MKNTNLLKSTTSSFFSNITSIGRGVKDPLLSSIFNIFGAIFSSFTREQQRRPQEQRRPRLTTLLSPTETFSPDQDTRRQRFPGNQEEVKKKILETNNLLIEINKNLVVGFELLQKTIESSCCGGEKLVYLKNAIVNLTKETVISKKTGAKLYGSALDASLKRAKEIESKKNKEIISLLESLKKVSNIQKVNNIYDDENRIQKVKNTSFLRNFNFVLMGVIDSISRLASTFFSQIEDIGKGVKDPLLSLVGRLIPSVFDIIKKTLRTAARKPEPRDARTRRREQFFVDKAVTERPILIKQTPEDKQYKRKRKTETPLIITKERATAAPQKQKTNNIADAIGGGIVGASLLKFAAPLAKIIIPTVVAGAAGFYAYKKQPEVSSNIQESLNKMTSSLNEIFEKLKDFLFSILNLIPGINLKTRKQEELKKFIPHQRDEQQYAGRAGRNLNPGNIRQLDFARDDLFYGTVGIDEKGFNIFRSELHGIRALFRNTLVQMKKHDLHTPEQIIKKYAPEEDMNDLINYRKTLEKEGVIWDEKLDTTEKLINFVAAIPKAEASVSLLERYTRDDLKKLLEAAKLDDVTVIERKFEEIKKRPLLVTSPTPPPAPTPTPKPVSPPAPVEKTIAHLIPSQKEYSIKQERIVIPEPTISGPVLNAESMVSRIAPQPVFSLNPITASTTIVNNSGGAGGGVNTTQIVSSPRSLENTFEKATMNNFMLSLLRTHLG